MRRVRRRHITAVLMAVLAAAVSAAFAASLGGLDTRQLGADVEVIGSCDTDGVSVDFAYGFSPAAGGYTMNSVALSEISEACDGQIVVVWLADENGLVAQTVALFDAAGGSNTEMVLPLEEPTPRVEEVGRVVVIFQSDISPVYLNEG